MVQRPAALDEVLRAEEGDREQAQAKSSVQEDLHLLIAEKHAHRGSNGAIGWEATED